MDRTSLPAHRDDPRRGDRRGVSLTETVIATALMGIVLTGVAGLAVAVGQRATRSELVLRSWSEIQSLTDSLSLAPFASLVDGSRVTPGLAVKWVVTAPSPTLRDVTLFVEERVSPSDVRADTLLVRRTGT